MQLCRPDPCGDPDPGGDPPFFCDPFFVTPILGRFFVNRLFPHSFLESVNPVKASIRICGRVSVVRFLQLQRQQRPSTRVGYPARMALRHCLETSWFLRPIKA